MLIIAGISFLFQSGCKDPEEVIPSYLYIPSIDLEVNEDGSEGASSHEIVDAWVYVGSDFIGVFEMPVTIPVLASGKKDVTVLAGIKRNGISSDREIYPFYRGYSVEMELIPSKVDTLRPVVEYREDIKFVWMEDFEDNTLSLEGSGSNTTTDSLFITDDAEDVFEYDGVANRYSGKVIMPKGLQIFENRSVDLFDFPRSGQEIFLELNFKCNTEFIVGLYPFNNTIINGLPVVNLFSTEDSEGVMQWKKVYVSFKEDVNSARNIGADFKVFFNTQTNVSEGEPQIVLDNIKLLHF